MKTAGFQDIEILSEQPCVYEKDTKKNYKSDYLSSNKLKTNYQSSDVGMSDKISPVTGFQYI